jgi:hypothetical protein
MVGCTQSQLNKVKKALSDTTTAITAVQATVIDLNKNGVLDDKTATNILSVVMKVDQTKIQVDKIVAGITANTIDKPTLDLIISLVNPVADSIKTLVINGTLGIKDPATKAKVDAGLTALETAVGVLEIYLSGGST